MDVRKLLKECLEEDSIDFLEVVYEETENNAKLLTPEFVQGLKKYKKNREVKRIKFEKDLDTLCNKNAILKNNIVDSLNLYVEALESENSYYVRNYYRLRSKRWCEFNDEIIK